MEGQPSEQERAARELAAREEAADFLLEKLDEKPRAALAMLARCCKREPAKRQVAQHWQEIAALLKSEDGKTRKNAAVLLGMLEQRDAAPLLVQALQAEQQLFARPSMILALGAIGGKEAREAVQALAQSESMLSGGEQPGGDGKPAEDKHARAEADAISKALSRLAPAESRSFVKLPGKMRVLLSPVAGLYDSLQHEADALGIQLQKQKGLAAVETDDYPGLFRMRCFHQAMLPVAWDIAYTSAALARACSGRMGQILADMHAGRGNFSARLELRKPPKGVNRAGFASEFFRLAQGYTNSPSGYDIELRAVGNGDKADLFCLLHSFADERFAYRQGSVPASINPAAAAAALRLALPRIKDEARVLDPFCGSGTMLIERSMLSACSALHGVDISGDACHIARRNAKAAGVEMPVYRRDIIGFKAEQGYDEIICNMPFGNRVGNHSSNERLYSVFFAQLPGLLNPGGFALCITTEKALLRRCASGMKIAMEVSFSYGGLNPSAFILLPR